MSIKKIAEIAGVSPSTVSRVLNNPNYRCQSPKIQEKIWKVAIELNYMPNEAARNLKLGIGGRKNYYVNVLMTRMDEAHTDPFFSELLRVIESEVHKAFCVLSSVWYMSVFSDDEKCGREDMEDVIRKMREEAGGRGDGLIIIGKCNKGALKILKKSYKSIVSVNRNPANLDIDEVTCDGRKVAAMAVEHLIGLGHRQIGYIGAVHNESRFRGFAETLHKHGIDISPEYIVDVSQTEEGGVKAIRKLLRQDYFPTGIYCANDITAIGVLKFLRKYKNLPYFPSVISSDDIEAAQYCEPMLTTVYLPKEEMGRFAMQLLLDRMQGGHTSVAKLELEGKLMVRNSCMNVGEGSYYDYCI